MLDVFRQKKAKGVLCQVLQTYHFSLEVSAFSSSDFLLCFVNAMKILFIKHNILKCFYEWKLSKIICLIATLLFKNG